MLLPVELSHNRTVPSALAEAIVLPSGSGLVRQGHQTPGGMPAFMRLSPAAGAAVLVGMTAGIGLGVVQARSRGTPPVPQESGC